MLSPLAMHGLAGEFVRSTAPHTEADPAAILATVLTVFGAMVGRGVYVAVGDECHHAPLFCLIVGSTGRARKGTSLAAVFPALRAAGPDAERFFAAAVCTGSRPAMGRLEDGKRFGDPLYGEVPDHRALVIEEEFAGVLVAGQHQGSTLSMGHPVGVGWQGLESADAAGRADLGAAACGGDGSTSRRRSCGRVFGPAT